MSPDFTLQADGGRGSRRRAIAGLLLEPSVLDAGAGSELWMFLNVVTVFYLNQRDIRELVGVTLAPVVDVPSPTGAS